MSKENVNLKLRTEDAINAIMHLVLKQLEDSGAPARLLFNDFSLAFSTLQLHLLIQKLKQLQLLFHF